MRILALRGSNLTSLAGPFEIDLAAPPLADAGLFAITGPTGAGKSTLLDALCLALYDRLPRLENASRTEVGSQEGDQLGGNDVRSVLRHGCAEAFADVEFIGRDGGHYRARWDVRRARGKTDGKLQPQTLSLVDATTGEAVASGKSETLRLIRDLVGLDFKQFRRSVLLAQNEFDAFLQAKSAERADLLEMMTGTEIYGQLSMAAHGRARDEATALAHLDEDLRRINVLPDDERTAVEAAAVAADAETLRLEAEVGHLTQAAAWYRTESDLIAGIADATRQVEAATTAVADAQPDHDRLQQVRSALTIQGLVADADRLTTEAARAETDATEAGAALDERRDDHAAAEARREEAMLADKTAERAIAEAQPHLDAATALDTRIGENHRQVQALAEALAASATYEKDCRAALQAQEQERAKAVAEAARLDDWLKAEAGRRSLADHLDHWLNTISSHAEAQGRRAAAEKAGEAAAGLVARIDEQTAAATTALEASETEVAALNDHLADLDGRLAGLDPDALESQREHLAAQDLALQGLLDLTEAASSLTRRRANLTEREDAARAQQTAAAAILTACGEQAPHLSGRLSEARAALSLAEAAESGQADLLRQKLIDGEPCPVCGSRDHPLHEDGGALSALVRNHRQRVDDLEGQVRAFDQKKAEAAASEKAALDALHHAAADRRELEAEHDAAVQRWSQAVAGALMSDLPKTPFEGVDLSALNAARRACAAALAAVKEQTAGARALEKDRKASAAKLHAAQAVRQAQAATLSALAPQRAEAEAARQSAEKDATREAAEAARLATALAEPLAFLAEWRQALADADALAQRCRALAAEWVQASTALEAGRQTAQKLTSQCDSARTVLDGAERSVKRDETLLADARKALDGLIAQRAGLFDGRPTAEVRGALQAACADARRVLDAAQDACSTARSALTGAEERVQACDSRRAELAKALSAAAETRDAHLAGLGLTLAAVREAMALGHNWVAEEEKRHSALRQALSSAEAVLQERRRTLARHEEQGRPALAPDAVTVALTDASAGLEEAREQAALVRQRLADDARNRDSARDTRARIVVQRQRHDLWKGLSDLIGSANGQKFRQFAQGLTLDRLLEHANGHLADLTPRYLLQRAPGGDLDLQVIDRDMADEVRGVANLSGGERFLVSLALALGLSSMTGRHVISESLFIDEGFGALDAHSLDVAISALETLQASGRKIGVISHVQPMIDRIGVQVRVSKQGAGRSVVQVLPVG